MSRLRNDLETFRKEFIDREARQTLRDQSNVQSLVNLRDSTQKAFSQVQQDVSTLLKQVQRLNERVSAVESQRLVRDGLSERIDKIERLLKLYEDLRKAQAEVAKANGAFLAF